MTEPVSNLRRTLRTTDRRGWMSSGLGGLLVAVLGLGMAGAVSLLPSQPTAQGSTRLAITRFTSTGPNLDVFDTTKRTLRDSAAQPQARAQALQRSYQLATDSAETATTGSAMSRAARAAALASTKAAARQTAEREAAAQEQQQIQQQVAAEMKARAAEFKAAAEAEAARPTVGGNASASGPVGTVVSPISSPDIGARWHQFGFWSSWHTGVDFVTGAGTPIHAAADGVVTFAGTNSDSWAGIHVAIRHSDGESTLYAHMSRSVATEGELVKAGDVIGYVGSTGRAFGPHLHFELYPAGVRPGDVYQTHDPLAWLRDHGVSV